MNSPLLVRDLMTVGVATCPADLPVTDLARRFLNEGLEEIVVLEEGNALGVVSREDLLKAYLQDDPSPLTGRDILREGVPQVPPDIPLKAAAQVMLDQHAGALYLMHHAGGIEYPAAVISYWHLLRHLGSRKGDDLSDLGIYAKRESPLQTFFQRRDAARKVNSSKKVK
jgi:predicted transcriptional regulator